ncbi:hypothetical protein GCM10010837_24240 [Aminobacter niigataensis]
MQRIDMAKKAQTQTGNRAIRAIFGDAQSIAEDEKPIVDLDPNEPRNGIKPGQWPGWPDSAMPPEHPVKVIGRNAAGSEYYFLTATGHFRTISKFDGRTLADLYAPLSDTLKWCWPAFGKKKVWDQEQGQEVEKLVVKRVERDQAFDCLMNEAARKPDFDPYSQHRGRGGWQDSQGRFLWHSGGWLWAANGSKLERSRPAEHDGFLYTRQAATIEPWREAVRPEESPARRILNDLRTWNWQRPYLDPILVLGWLGTALMGGALKARPILFTSGGAGVGKSTLLELMRSALEGAVITTVNTTAAGIYQRAKLDSLPFLVDELESKAGSTRADNVIELARVAYTGGDISRGGQDHEATTFTARNSFGFFAINPPPMGPQDKSRMALVNLARLNSQNALKLTLKPETDGRMMLRQIMDGWTDFQGRLLSNYYDELKPHGLDSRAIDTFGTLLAAAELLVGPEALEDCGLPVASVGRLGEMVAAATSIERSETLDNWHECLDHLFQSPIDAWRDGVKPTIGQVCEKLRQGPSQGGWDAAGARERLQLVNLGAVDKGKVRGAPHIGACLAVPLDGPMLKRIFADTKFQQSVWYSALKGAPTDIVIRGLGNGQKVRINDSVKTCLLIDLDAFEEYASAVE